MTGLFAFISTFVSYLLLVAVFVVVAVAAVFIGIRMRKSKNAKTGGDEGGLAEGT